MTQPWHEDVNRRHLVVTAVLAACALLVLLVHEEPGPPAQAAPAAAKRGEADGRIAYRQRAARECPARQGAVSSPRARIAP